MKRQDVVSKLLKEGFSEKTLVNFSDKQLEKLSNMIVTETLNIPKDDKQAIEKAKMDKKMFDTYEGEMNEKWDSDAEIEHTGEYEDKTVDELQKQLDNLKSRSKKYQDKGKDVPESIKKKEKQVMFAIRAKKNWKGGVDEQEKEEWGKPERENKLKSLTQDQKGRNPIKNVKNKEKALKRQKGFDKSKDVTSKREEVDENTNFMKKQHINTGFKGVDKKLKTKNSIVEWVEKLAEKKYSNLTLKKEIMEMVTTKIEQHEEAKAKKGHNGIPEFMTYDAIKSNAPVKEPTTKPAEPKTRPGTRPRPKTPYQPGPGTNPKPKAMGDNKIK